MSRNYSPSSSSFPTRFAIQLTGWTIVLFMSFIRYESFPNIVSIYKNPNQTHLIEIHNTNNIVNMSKTRISPLSHPIHHDSNNINIRRRNLRSLFDFTSSSSSSLFVQVLKILFLSPLIVLCLLVLFRMLASTAEDYFSPPLEMFSYQFHLPPRLAGVTLLALGNGASDVASTIKSMLLDPIHGYDMSIGALTGAGMFVSTIISALVIHTAPSPGIHCKGALIRDISMYLITNVVLWFYLGGPSIFSQFSFVGKQQQEQKHDSTATLDDATTRISTIPYSTETTTPTNTTATAWIDQHSIHVWLSFYFLYIAMVLFADIYHRIRTGRRHDDIMPTTLLHHHHTSSTSSYPTQDEEESQPLNDTKKNSILSSTSSSTTTTTAHRMTHRHDNTFTMHLPNKELYSHHDDIMTGHRRGDSPTTTTITTTATTTTTTISRHPHDRLLHPHFHPHHHHNHNNPSLLSSTPHCVEDDPIHFDWNDANHDFDEMDIVDETVRQQLILYGSQGFLNRSHSHVSSSLGVTTTAATAVPPQPPGSPPRHPTSTFQSSKVESPILSTPYISIDDTGTTTPLLSSSTPTTRHDNNNNNNISLWKKIYSTLWTEFSFFSEWNDVYHALKLYFRDVWVDIIHNEEYTLLDKILLICEYPFTVLRQVKNCDSIDFVPFVMTCFFYSYILSVAVKIPPCFCGLIGILGFSIFHFTIADDNPAYDTITL